MLALKIFEVNFLLTHSVCDHKWSPLRVLNRFIIVLIIETYIIIYIYSYVQIIIKNHIILIKKKIRPSFFHHFFSRRSALNNMFNACSINYKYPWQKVYIKWLLSNDTKIFHFFFFANMYFYIRGSFSYFMNSVDKQYFLYESMSIRNSNFENEQIF